MKCIWCGKKLSREEIEKNIYYRELDWNESIRFCCEDCEIKYKKFMEEVDKNKIKFLISLFGGLIVYVIGTIVLSNKEIYQSFFSTIYFLFLGLTLIRYPYGTPETTMFLGIKKTRYVVKGMGIIIILGSLAFKFL